VKTHDSLQTTIGNPILFRRAAAALLALVVLLAVIGLARLARPVAQAPVANPSAQISSASAHDGSAYVEYLSSRTPIESAPVAMPNPNMPISGAGSAYDGGAYGTSPATTTPNPNTPVIGTGSVYDGGTY
jgi:hypothetical protein